MTYNTDGTIDFVVGGTPVTQTEEIYYGIADGVDDLANLDVSGFAQEDATIAGHDLTLGPTSQANQHFVIFAPSDHDILTLVNVGLQEDDLTAFAKTENLRTLNSESYDSYTLGPLNNGVRINYQLTLQE